MNQYDDFPSFMVRLTCVKCQNVFWVPEFDAVPRIEGICSMPRFCTYCGAEFDTEEMVA